MFKKKPSGEFQLSLFEPNPPENPPPKEPTTVLEFIKARLDHGPEMTQEEYKRWIKIIVNNSLKRME